MVEGPEHRQGWRKAIEVDGERVLIEARHVGHRRLPRGHEIARQAVRGRPYTMVEELRFEWAVVAHNRLIASLQQSPSGDFHVGALRSFPRLGIEQAAAAAYRLMGPSRKNSSVRDEIAPSEDITNDADAPAPPGAR
jgi:hypothetical protein